MRVRLAIQPVRRGRQQNRDREDARSQAGADGRPRLSQQPCDAIGERSAIGGNGGGKPGPEVGRAVRAGALSIGKVDRKAILAAFIGRGE